MKIITRKEAQAEGLTRYFTGKPCKWGHVAERRVSGKGCVECGREGYRKWRAENIDHERDRGRQRYTENRDWYLEYNRQYRAENPDYFRRYRAYNADHIREYNRQYRDENREKRAEYNRQWRAENLEWEQARRRQYRAENLEQEREYSRQYKVENPEKNAAQTAKRRAAKMDRTLSHEDELTNFVMQEAAQHARDMDESFGMPFHVDHMIPMQGSEVSGLHVWYNLQVLPASLNVSKGNRMIYTESLEWLAHAS